MFCDDWRQASHNGELAHAVEAGLLGRDDVTELGAVLAGSAPGRRSDDEITVFDSTGLAIQDLAIALAAMEHADELDLPRSTSRRCPQPPGGRSRADFTPSSRRGRALPAGTDPGARGPVRHLRSAGARPLPGVQSRRAGSNQPSSGASRPSIACRDRARRRAGRGRCRGRSSRRQPRGGRRRERGRRTGRKSSTRPKIPGPALLDGDRPADQIGHEGFERPLDPGVDPLVGGELRLERPVAKPAGEHAAVGRLLPVVEAVPAVVRALEHALGQGLGRDHLTAGRHDQPLERTEEAARIAVGRDEHAAQRRLRRATSTRLCSRISTPASAGQHCEPADPARGLQCGVARMEDRAGEAPAERLVDPLRREAVLAQPRVLDRQGITFLPVGGQAQAPGPPECVAGQRLDAVERVLRQPPQPPRRSPADRLRRHVVGSGSAAQRETAVPAARPARDLACVVEPDAEPRLGKCACRRTPVIPPPTTSTSAAPSSRRSGIGGAGSESQ